MRVRLTVLGYNLIDLATGRDVNDDTAEQGEPALIGFAHAAQYCADLTHAPPFGFGAAVSPHDEPCEYE